MSLVLIAVLRILAGLVGFATGIVSSDSYPGTFPPWIHALLVSTFAAAGTLIIVGGRRDERARLLGSLYLILSSTFTFRLFGAAATQPGTTPIVSQSALLLFAVQPEAFAPWFLWKFVARFPSAVAPPRTERATRFFVGLALACGAVLFLANCLVSLAPPRDPFLLALLSPLDRGSDFSLFWPVQILLILSAFAFMFLRVPAAGAREQRRVRLFVASLAGGAAPMMIDVIAEALVPGLAAFMSQPTPRLISGLVAYPALLSVPFTTGYAVIVERVLDVRLVIRKAVRYGIVRLSAAAALVLPACGFAWLVYRQRDRTVSELVSGDVVWLVAGTLALLGVFKARRPIFDAIDRHFFREQYDARRILADLPLKIRDVTHLRDLARLLRAEIELALHPDSVAILVKDTTGGGLMSPDGTLLAPASPSMLVSLVGGSHEPLDVDLERERSALRRLPADEQAWLAGAAARLIVPVTASGDRLLGMIVLGEKKSEQPFSGEDRSLLSAVAAAASLAIENWMLRTTPEALVQPAAHGLTPAPAARAGDDRLARADECTACGTVQPSGEPICGRCGGRVAPAPIPPEVGGKFAVQRKVGAGGMGVVYLANDLALNRQVALKTLTRLSHDSVTRLRQEARAMAAVEHPNLAVIHGVETWLGMPILVCEFFAGGTLADRLRVGPLAVGELCRVGSLLAGALNHLHRSGLLHRDIKPSNIGFTSQGVPKLFDFGLARLLEPQVSSAGQPDTTTKLPVPGDRSSAWGAGVQPLTEVVGTAAYLSPEATLGGAARPALDVWALALTLYQALTGVQPFLADNVAAILRAIRETDVPDARTHRPDCPASLAELLSECLIRDQATRLRKAGVLGQRFARLAPDSRFPIPAS